MGQWQAQEWGKPNRGWICPAARLETASHRKAIPGGQNDPDFYPGSVDSAWEIGRQFWWKILNMASNDRRAGSYAANSWLDGNWWWSNDNFFDWRRNLVFVRDEQITEPSTTPMMGDAVTGPWGWGLGFDWVWGGGWGGPQETDFPSPNLEFGRSGPFYSGMSQFCIPRHGSRPSIIATNYPLNLNLPGAVNLSFIDGHVQQVKLDRLWQQTWHRNYQVPSKRPGLP